MFSYFIDTMYFPRMNIPLYDEFSLSFINDECFPSFINYSGATLWYWPHFLLLITDASESSHIWKRFYSTRYESGSLSTSYMVPQGCGRNVIDSNPWHLKKCNMRNTTSRIRNFFISFLESGSTKKYYLTNFTDIAQIP